MAKEKKSIIEEALLEAKSLEDALKANTKEILASTMKEEINSVVRESLNEQGVEDDELEDQNDKMEDGLPVDDAGDDSIGDEELGDMEMDLGDEEGIELDLELGDEEMGAELGDEEGSELPMDIGDELDDEGVELDLELGDEEGMLGDLEGLGDEDEMDLTMAGDDEVMKVFKKLSDDDEIEVVKDEDGISLKDNQTGAEYYIKESDQELEEGEICEGCSSGMMEDETIYEVELDEDMYETYMESDKMEDEDQILDEDKLQRHRKKSGKQRYSGAKLASESKRRRKPLIKESRNRKPARRVTESKSNVRNESYQKLLKEYKVLKARNGEYKEALKVFKTKINEVALFNQNLAHATRLFTEHSTTKKEKMKILKRFDDIETIKESKSLFKSIEGELGEKTPITESVDKKVNKTIDSSKSKLNESTAYVDPSVMAIKDLMKRIER